MLTPLDAEVQVLDEYDRERGLVVRQARLLDPLTMQPLAEVPTLYNAILVTMRSDYFVLAGIERLTGDLDNRVFEYAQMWELQLQRPD